MKRSLPVLLLVVVFAYGGMCAYLYAAQDTLMYFPTAAVASDDAEALEFSNDGERLRVWKLGEGRRALLYFGGNAENVAYAVEQFDGLLPDTAVYLHNYRGYGGSSGEPGEAAFHSDARFLFDELKERHVEIAVIGRSLGSAVAARLAAERPVARLVLVTPFDSAANVAKEIYPIAPVGLLMRDQYRSIDHVPDIASPVLVLIADNDRVIPYRNTMALVSRFPPSQLRVQTISNSGHNSISRSPAYVEALRDFLQAPADVARTAP